MKKLLYIILALLVIVLADAWLRSDVIRLDGLRGEIFGLLLHSDTKYAAGYSHRKFAQVKPGMTEQQVLEILGEPQLRWLPYRYTVFKDRKHFVGLQYSISPSGTHYRLRQVYLDNGRVAQVIHYYYVD